MTTQLERDLRELLADRASGVSGGLDLAERILASAPGERSRREIPPNLRRWAPAAAAAAVVALIAGALALVGRNDPTPATHHPSPTASGIVPRPTPNPNSTSSAPRLHAVSTGFRARDLTFVSDEQGFALGTVPCGARPGRCAVLLATSDGRHWTVRNRHLPSALARGVNGVRFASPATGYAYGPHALFMTTDGGRSWSRSPGGAIALETDGQTVLRVTSPHSGCPAWCDVAVQTAPVGSSTWTPVRLPTPDGSGTISTGYGVTLSRNGTDVYLAALGHTAGGSADASTTLYASHDSGQTWTRRADPCPFSQTYGSPRETDTVVIAAAPDGVLTVGCQPRVGGADGFVMISTDGGAAFTAEPGRVLLGEFLAGFPSTMLLSADQAASPPVFLSTDGGRTWRPVTQVTGTPVWVGAESPEVAHIVTDGGRVLWTTRDSGADWKSTTFS